MLTNIATIELASGPTQINRLDRARNIILEVELNGIALGQMEEAIASTAKPAAIATRHQQGRAR